jgi:NAD(P)-dependent dehydrogenase (short-subunit alcohol dehydrogenase family)
VLVNMGSVWGRITTPDVSAYVTSKFALRAFSECLRQELRGDPGIDVALILPQAVDTPIFARAGNFSGRPARPIPPIYDPEVVARGIVACARSPKREVTYGRAGRALEVLHAFAPPLHHRLLPPAFEAGNYGRGSAPSSPGTVLASPPDAPYGIDGGWRTTRRRETARALLATAGGVARGLFRGR